MFVAIFRCVVRERLSAEVTFELTPKGQEDTSRQSTRQKESVLRKQHARGMVNNAGRNLRTSRNRKKASVAKAS